MIFSFFFLFFFFFFGVVGGWGGGGVWGVGCRKLHNKELNDLQSSPNIVRVIKLRRTRWEEHVTRMGEKRGILVGDPEGKRPLGRHRCRSEENIKMDLQEVGCRGYGLDRSGLG
jgi:hypothetical protein